MRQIHSAEEAQERAALYALGALPADEAESFEEHLRSGCEACARELSSFVAVVDELSLAGPTAQPGDHVRAAALERLTTPEFEEQGVRFVRAGQMPWQPTSLPNVERKQLFRDNDSGYRTQVVRLPPGGRYPGHRHTEVEEIYLVEGDLSVSGFIMHAGDYCRAEPGSVHEDVHSIAGCTFVVLSSEHDQFLP
jgi:quercetin dioxygenase-like cupin family protein